MSNVVYSTLVNQGFRRSGEYVYRPGCIACRACKSLRIPVRDFSPSRRHRRCLAANSAANVQRVTASYREEHFQLYQRYLASRHAGSQMADPTSQQYLEFLTASWCNSAFYEFREEGRLLAVAAVDELHNGLSAVYTFYEPELPQRGLGTLAILWLLGEAHRLGLPYLYLGYWIEESPKMRYKQAFRPHEVFDAGTWRTVA